MAIWVVAGVTFASGLVVAVRMRETLGRKPPTSDRISADELATRAHEGAPLAIVEPGSRGSAVRVPIATVPA